MRLGWPEPYRAIPNGRRTQYPSTSNMAARLVLPEARSKYPATSDRPPAARRAKLRGPSGIARVFVDFVLSGIRCEA